jgi:nitroreductase
MPLIQPKYSDIEKRCSVRTYKPVPISDAARGILKYNLEAIASESGPFGHSIRLVILDHNVAGDRDKLGTYGVIKGARHYLAGAVPIGETALIDFGYQFEKAVLICTALQLGTCWLGGTFRRSEFANALKLSRGEVLPCISPVGITSQSPSLTDRVFRRFSGGDRRISLGTMAFSGSFSQVATPSNLGECHRAVEAVRLAPSASNKQPWRILTVDGQLHLYLEKSLGYSKGLGFDIQLVDAGIAMCHVEVAERELGRLGRWAVLTDVPNNPLYEYIATWSV